MRGLQLLMPFLCAHGTVIKALFYNAFFFDAHSIHALANKCTYTRYTFWRPFVNSKNLGFSHCTMKLTICKHECATIKSIPFLWFFNFISKQHTFIQKKLYLLRPTHENAVFALFCSKAKL